MYHAVADCILANSLLRSQPEVDQEKVGIMGVSWGGVITSTVMGIDPRFAFAIPTYGCGRMADAENHWGAALGENAFYREVWDPLHYLPQAKMPTLWFSWPEDHHFPLDAQAASYRAMSGDYMVSLLLGMRHSTPARRNPPDSYAFAESVIRDGKPWCSQISARVNGTSLEVVYSSSKPLDRAVLISTTDIGFTGNRKWIESPARLQRSDRQCVVTANLPKETTACFVNVKAGDLTVSSEYVELGRAADEDLPSAAAENSLVVQRADGCVVMDAGHAQVEGNRWTFGFELTHPGEYTVQVIARIEDSTGNPSATVDVEGKPLSDSLTKAYVIEDGVVSEFEKPATFTEAGRHTLSLRSTVAPAKVRLVPQIYTKSRIYISSSKYYDAWLDMHESPKKQAAMAWHKEARFGMFIHWGVYSQAAGSWKGARIEDSPIKGPRVAEWIMFTFQIPRKEYREFAKQFNPDKSFAVNIARLARDTGMRYVVITSKHHDGFGLFDSAHSDFDIADSTPYQGDLIKELYDACRAEGLDFGVYYSHGHDWGDGSDGDYANVKKYNDTLGVPTRPNGKNLWDPSPNTFDEYLKSKAYPQIAELLELLPDLRLIWFDGEGLITEAQAFRFYKMIYDINPGVIINRRIGYDFGDYVDAGDNKTPTARELATKHFETCGTANHSWGFKAHDHNWKSTNGLLRNFVDIVSKGGNYLLNIGPDGKGNVPEPCMKNFREMGVWVKTNEDAIFGTTRWTTLNEGVAARNAKRHPVVTSTNKEFWFSARGDEVYAMSLAPATGTVRIQSLKQSAGTIANVRLLGSSQELKWTQTDEALEIDLTGIEASANGYAVEITLRNRRT